jgi:hypothetical protein
MLRRIFGPNRNGLIGEWRKLHGGELHNIYSSPNFIRQLESRKMTWVGHVAHARGEKSVQGFGRKTEGKETTWKSEA